MDEFGGGDNLAFLRAGDCDLVHNLTLVQRDAGDNIRSIPFLFILPSRSLEVVTVVSKCEDCRDE